ncbi:MAG: hypothetical protein C0442_11085 [Chlorobiaceae bacterium]|nr:hypothetical protein [Chlorobiaceae bacterium]
MKQIQSNQQVEKVAIVLSVYNGEKYIEDQLNSIINQTYKNWILYIRNDGSKDNSQEIIEHYQGIDNRIKLIDKNAVNIGYNKSQLTLLKHVSEQYIAFCDQDDVFFPDKLEKTLEKIIDIETSEKIPALVYTEALVVDSQLNLIKNTFIGKHGRKPGLNGIVFANCVSGSSMMINGTLKNLVLESIPLVRFDLLDFHIAILSELGGVRAFIPQPLLKYRQHENNTVGTVGTKKTNETVKYTLSLISGLNNYLLFKNEYTKIETSRSNKILLDEFFYLFEGKNRFKKMWIFLKNRYGFTRKKDFLMLFFLIVKNQDLRTLITVKL